MLAGLFFTLIWDALPSIKAFGFRMIFGTEWNPVSGEFGAKPFLIGTLLTSFLALLISIPFALSMALFLGEYFRGSRFATFFQSLVEIPAGIPSVVYGLWGIFILVPLIRNVEVKFNLDPYGVGIFTAALLLSIMIVPYATSIMSETIQLVPHDLKEAAYSLGATRYELIRNVVLPYARSGIFAGVLLALGRALGETMAVTMVIGNSNAIPRSLFAPGNTMASIIANEFTEASDPLHLAALIEIGVLLFIVTLIINMAGKFIISRTILRSNG